MIIYRNTKGGFIADSQKGVITKKIEEEFLRHGVINRNLAEHRAWNNSMTRMALLLNDQEIPDDVELAIEYQIPMTAKRVDFIIAGKDENDSNNVVIIELKQWENSERTSHQAVVKAYTGGSNREVTHPCYQAYSYAKTIENFNESIARENISLKPCAYLHNYPEVNRGNIDNAFYKEAIECAPLFLQEDAPKLKAFIKKFIKKRDNVDLLMKIDHGKLKPAKALQDALPSMLRGNEEFYLIDEQKVAYETVQKLVQEAVGEANVTGLQKSVVIVKGGPGTGKSVIAVKLLCNLIAQGFSAIYVTKNRAPRDVYSDLLTKSDFKKRYIKILFQNSGSFVNSTSNTFDCIVADEAHRLKAKSGFFENQGENQIKEIINASKVAVFFIDEDQKVTTKDIGSVDEILKWARHFNAKIYDGEEITLVSQFRCNGSDGYLNFLDNLLEIRETPNYTFEMDYDIKLFSSPTAMREALRKKNAVNNKSRMIAGYCYEWISKKEPKGDKYDIVLEDGFKAKWNFDNTLFAIAEDSFEQVGCIHTTQGLEFDYCGIIIGKDLRYENGQVITDTSKIAKTDKSSGIRSCKDQNRADRLIRNTYKTLLSRGQKGCFVYCEDKPLLEYMSKMLGKEIIVGADEK